jgi:TonB-linked SusC/RagA family outer membrane protein
MRTFVHRQSRLFVHFCWLLAMLLCSLPTMAQDKTINGKVTDAKKQPLPGVSVQVKGTTRGTATSGEGTFKITAKTGEVLIVSFMGYLMQEVPVTGTADLNITLQEDVKQLEGVVVTALGIKRSQMALGYATQTVGEKQMTDAKSNNWSSALSGKVAGLTLSSPGGPMGSTRINLRGDRSMKAGGNDALIVVDGVPMNSSMVSSGADNAYQAGSGADVPVDYGNGIADINPDDIESITVLKGAGATALYGSRASNGALIITTKSGSRKGKGIGVTVNSNFSVNDVLRWPDLQYEYGQGVGKTFTPAGDLYYSFGNSADGANTGSTSSAFGPKFNGQKFFQYDPATGAQSLERMPWVPYKNNIKDFYKTGFTLTNSVSMEGGNDKGSARASFTHTKNEWIMPNTGFERMTAALSTNYNVSEKLKLNAKVNFTNKRSDNLPATGYNNQSMSYFMIFQNPNVDLDWYRPIWKPGKEQIDQIHPFSSYIDNPYLIAYEMTNSVNNNSVVGNLSATYNINKNWDVMVRSGLTMANEARQQRRPFSTANFAQGYYKEQQMLSYEINTDGLITYHTDLSPKFKLNTSVGGNLRRSRMSLSNAYINGLVNPGVYKLSNGLYSVIYKGDHADRNVNSLYALANLSYDEKIFVDVTGRNDWSSTLPKGNWSFFYPSVNTSFILNRIFDLPQAVSYSKFRFSVAQVGNDTDPYGTRKYYLQSDFPSSSTVDPTLYNGNIKPEISTSYEAGLEGQFFGSRIGFDVSLYQTNTKNQIIEMPLDYATGYNRAIVNGGNIRNRGVEVVLNGKPIG